MPTISKINAITKKKLFQNNWFLGIYLNNDNYNLVLSSMSDIK